MNGEIAIGGVFVPELLLLAFAALLVTAVVSRWLAARGAYRFFAYRPLADVSLFTIVTGLLVGITIFIEGLP